MAVLFLTTPRKSVFAIAAIWFIDLLRFMFFLLP
jgi:hypothetical protein